jgi:citronellol/citronellal dehydrogenase
MNETLSGDALNGETLNGKTLFITGAARGIGLAIALRAARDGANVVIAGRSIEHNPKLPGTIFTAASEIEEAGGVALPLRVDLRDEAQVRAFRRGRHRREQRGGHVPRRYAPYRYGAL